MLERESYTLQKTINLYHATIFINLSVLSTKSKPNLWHIVLLISLVVLCCGTVAHTHHETQRRKEEKNAFQSRENKIPKVTTFTWIVRYRM